jgi:hypothetical protein
MPFPVTRSYLSYGATLLLWLAVGSLALGSVRTFRVSQSAQLEERETAIRVYLHVLDEENRAVETIREEQISGTLGEELLQQRSLGRFDRSREGVAYVFLIDISRSLSVQEFEVILDALDVWILALRPRDRVAVVAFGNTSQVIVDFTNDIGALKAGLYALGPTDEETVLHEALNDGLELCQRRDRDLPGRRVIIVLSDGRDEGSGLTEDDFLAVLRNDPVPIYAIGLSRLGDPQIRRRYLDLLHRFASNSGGAFFEGSTGNLGSAYEAIRQAIHGVWVADFVCSGCRPDGEVYRLQVNFAEDGRVLSDGKSLRLLPQVLSTPAPVAAAPSGSEEAEAPAASEEDEEMALPAAESEESGSTKSGGFPGWLWLLPLLLAAAAAWVWFQRRSLAEATDLGPGTEEIEAPTEATAAATPTAEPTSDHAPPEPVVDSYTTESGVETTRPARPAVMRLVRMIVVRGEKSGRQYTLTLFKSAIVGSRSTCDCVLSETGVASLQFELYQLDGRVYIRNLADSNPTLVDGMSIPDRHQLKSGSLVGNRDFIVRLVYEEPRPIHT